MCCQIAVSMWWSCLYLVPKCFYIILSSRKLVPKWRLVYVAIFSDKCKVNIHYLHVKHSGAETGIFEKNLVNTMTADALAPCVARASAAMVLTMQKKTSPSLPSGKISTSISVLRNDRKHKYIFMFPKNDFSARSKHTLFMYQGLVSMTCNSVVYTTDLHLLHWPFST